MGQGGTFVELITVRRGAYARRYIQTALKVVVINPHGLWSCDYPFPPFLSLSLSLSHTHTHSSLSLSSLLAISSSLPAIFAFSIVTGPEYSQPDFSVSLSLLHLYLSCLFIQTFGRSVTFEI